MTRIALIAALITATGVASAATQSICIDPHSYNAHSLNQHDVWVRNGIGKPRPPLRLTTSCINLEPATSIGIGSAFTCIGLGDRVVAHTIDGRVERCIVTHIEPYAPKDGDKKG